MSFPPPASAGARGELSAPSPAQHPGQTQHPRSCGTLGVSPGPAASGAQLRKNNPTRNKLLPQITQTQTKLAGSRSQQLGFSAPPAAGEGLASSRGMLRAQAELGAAQRCRDGVRPPDPTTTGHTTPVAPVATWPVPTAPQQPPATNLPALPMGPDDATPGSLQEKFPPRRPAASRPGAAHPGFAFFRMHPSLSL